MLWLYTVCCHTSPWRERLELLHHLTASLLLLSALETQHLHPAMVVERPQVQHLNADLAVHSHSTAIPPTSLRYFGCWAPSKSSISTLTYCPFALNSNPRWPAPQSPASCRCFGCTQFVAKHPHDVGCYSILQFLSFVVRHPWSPTSHRSFGCTFILNSHSRHATRTPICRPVRIRHYGVIKGSLDEKLPRYKVLEWERKVEEKKSRDAKSNVEKSRIE